jgi:DNA-binding MarR family transcriptional regulator
MALLKRMEKKGLLYRRQDSKNRKYTRLFLTEKGKAVYRRAMHLNVFDSIITGISENDKKQLQQYIEVLIKAAENYGKQQTDREIVS